MSVTIVICTWNRCELLRQTLDYMTRLLVPAGLDWELIVVNNNCTDRTDEVIAEFADRLPVRPLHEPRPGKSHALNLAIGASRGNHLLMTDDDVLVDERWLASFLGATERYPEAAAFGGPVDPWYPVDPDPDLLAAFPKLQRGFGTVDYGREEGPLPPDLDPNGANIAFRRSAIEDLRFDPNLGPSERSCRLGEEKELLERLRGRGGMVVWCPAMRVRHYNDPSRMTVEYMTRYAAGWARTVVRRRGVPPGRPIFGAPWQAWRRLLEGLVRYTWYLFVPSGRVARLQALRRYHGAKGALLECRAIHAESRVRQAIRGSSGGVAGSSP